MSDPNILQYTIAWVPTLLNDTTFAEQQFTSVSFYGLTSKNVLLNNYSGSVTVQEILAGVPGLYGASIVNLNLQITGTHYYDCSAGTKIDSAVVDTMGNTTTFPEFADNPGGFHSGNTTINYNNTITGITSLDNFTMNFQRYNSNSCTDYNFENIIVTFILTIQVGVCNAYSIDNQACLNYCNNGTTNLQACYPSYYQYCFTPTIAGNNSSMPIGSDPNCYNFFANYIGNVGTSQVVDNGIASYCQSTFRGFQDLFNGYASENQMKLCACHMNSSDYQTFATQLYNNFNGLSNLGLVNECLVPQCANTPIKSATTTSTCRTPCINIVDFTNNNGNFNNSTVQIYQNVSGCANVTNNTNGPQGPQGPQGSQGPQGNNGPQPSPQPGPSPRRDTYIYVLSIGFFVVLILIILAIAYATRRKSSKNQ